MLWFSSYVIVFEFSWKVKEKKNRRHYLLTDPRSMIWSYCRMLRGDYGNVNIIRGLSSLVFCLPPSRPLWHTLRSSEELQSYNVSVIKIWRTCSQSRKKVVVVLTGKPTVKRPLERSGCRWEDNIRMDLKEIATTYNRGDYFILTFEYDTVYTLMLMTADLAGKLVTNGNHGNGISLWV